MAYAKASSLEIDKKLRDDFRRRLKDFGISAEATDPILAVLFRTFAGQLEALYSETERIRLALLDELIAGLGFDRRAARPAQTIVRMLSDRASQLLDVGTELMGEADSGERLIFSTDASIVVSSAQVAVAVTYQDGLLRLMPGVELPEEMQSGRPSLEPVPVNLGANPAVFLAIENLPESHLSQHGFFFELGPDAQTIQRSLLSETWCLAGHEGTFGAKGILRPRRISAGVQGLHWLIDDASTPQAVASAREHPGLPDGFYSGRVFVFPVVPSWRRFLCQTPKGLGAALTKLFGAGSSVLFNAQRAWLRISMPREISALHTGIMSIALHAISACNVECLNQTIRFQAQGTSIPVSKEAGTGKHLVAPLSVLGEFGAAYLPEFQLSSNAGEGRYAIRNGRIQIRPAEHPDNQTDSYANLRLWLTSGSLGNKVGPGKVQVLVKKPARPLRITNLTSAAGGTDGETFREAQARFAEALLSRDRIVSRADMASAARAFDRRILGADVSAGLQRTGNGLRRIQRIKLRLNREGFLDLEAEAGMLREELTTHLRERCLYDMELVVELQWN